MGEYRGLMGGFFDQLGAGGVLNMAVAGAGYGFLHAYISSKVAGYVEEDVGSVKPELITMSGMLVPPAAWIAARYMGYLKDTDINDLMGNTMGAGLLWELWNGVETIIALLEEGD